MHGTWSRIFGAAVVFLATVAIRAEEVPETLLDGLQSPCGVAVQPGTEHVFVSDTGTGRVIRVVDGKVEDVITGFPAHVPSDELTRDVGPYGLAFQGPGVLVVAGSASPHGRELACVYSVPPAGSSPVPASQMKREIGPLPQTGQNTRAGGCRGVALTRTAVFVTYSGHDANGHVARSEIKASGYGKVRDLIAGKNAVTLKTPAAITISPRGEVVIGRSGELAIPRDSRLSFFNAKTGGLLLNLETGLFDLTGLAYREKHLLYALDFAGMNAAQGGLFRLDAVRKGGRQAVRAVKIASLRKPTAMAFAPDGTLYVTIWGTVDEGDQKKEGQLVKFAASVTGLRLSAETNSN